MKELSPTDIANRLHSTAIHLLRGLRSVDELAGISARRLSALSVIVFAGPITISELAQAEQVSLPTTSRMMKDMEFDGLVARIPDQDDKRSVKIQVTEQGLILFNQARQRRIQAVAERISTLNTEQLELLAQAVSILEQITLPQNHPHLSD